jgi:hypothetical protein
LRQLILAKRIAMRKVGGGDDKIVAQLVDHMREVIVEGAGDKDALGEPTVDLGSSASA